MTSVIHASVIALTLVLCGCSATPPPQPTPDPVIPAQVWREVEQELIIDSQDARYSAQTYAREAMEQWVTQVELLTEQEFIPWYTSFFTQQWLALKMGWYTLDSPDGGEDSADRLARHLQQEFYQRVLEPIAPADRPFAIMQQCGSRYVEYMAAAINSLRTRYRLPAADFNQRLRHIPAITIRALPSVDVSLYQLIQTRDLTRLPAYRALIAQFGPPGDDTRPGLSDNRFHAVSKRSAEELVDELALRGGGSVTALAVGGLPGILVSIAVSGWQAIEHEEDRPALEAHLRANLDAMRREMWRHLMDDPHHGVMAPVNHMAARVQRGIADRQPIAKPVGSIR